MGARTSLAAPIKSDDDYQAEDDHRTLQRADEVRNDPGRMKAVAAFHAKRLGQMFRIGQSLRPMSRKQKAKRAILARQRSRRS